MKFNNILNEALRNIPDLPGEDKWGLGLIEKYCQVCGVIVNVDKEDQYCPVCSNDRLADAPESEQPCQTCGGTGFQPINDDITEALRNIPDLPGQDKWGGGDSTFAHSEAIENNVVRIMSILKAKEGFHPDEITTILQESDAETIGAGHSDDYTSSDAFEYGVRFGKVLLGENQMVYRLYKDNVNYYWVASNENEVIAKINDSYERYIT